MKIYPLGAKMFHAGRQAGRQAGKQAGRHASRQADMMKLMVALCDFENVPKDGFQHSEGPLNIGITEPMTQFQIPQQNEML